MAEKDKKKSQGEPKGLLDTMPDAPDSLHHEIEKQLEEEAKRRSAAELPPASLPPTKKSQLPPELAHDDREIDSRAIGRMGIIVGAITVFAMVAGWFITRGLSDSEKRGSAAPAIAQSQPDVPADPRLQRLPRQGRAALVDEEERQLGSYAWVDRSRGVVQIPIEEAIARLAARGLPARQQQPEPASASLPDESSLRVPKEVPKDGGAP